MGCEALKPLIGVPSSEKYKQLHVKVSKDLNKVDSAFVVPKTTNVFPKIYFFVFYFLFFFSVILSHFEPEICTIKTPNVFFKIDLV